MNGNELRYVDPLLGCYLYNSVCFRLCWELWRPMWLTKMVDQGCIDRRRVHLLACQNAQEATGRGEWHQSTVDRMRALGLREVLGILSNSIGTKAQLDWRTQSGKKLFY